MATASVLYFSRNVARLECSKCGAEAEASCNCGAPYIPARDVAAKAIAANPKLSNRKIAHATGVSLDTVNRARKSTERNRSPAQAIEESEEKQILPPAARIRGFIYRADEAARGAQEDNLAGLRITNEMKAAAKRAARAWTKVVSNLNRKG